MIKIIMAPAMAKDSTSMANNFRMASPIKRKAIIINPATMVAFPDSIWPLFFLNSITTGIDPRISMIENNISVTDAISLKLNIIFFSRQS
jgi:hypothetical protein